MSEVALVTGFEDGDVALVEQRGTTRRVPLILLTSAGETVHIGDWLLVHTGLAVARVSADEAARQLTLLQSGDRHAQP